MFSNRLPLIKKCIVNERTIHKIVRQNNVNNMLMYTIRKKKKKKSIKNHQNGYTRFSVLTKNNAK
jgi:purine-nucleoside phosphorylase